VPFVYILRCRDGSYYTGAAKDLAARLRAHACGRASRYTRARLPVALAWSRRVRTWSRALREEYRIKQLTRAAKEALVSVGTQGADRVDAGRAQRRRQVRHRGDRQ
jgi:putative endonuclease